MGPVVISMTPIIYACLLGQLQMITNYWDPYITTVLPYNKLAYDPVTVVTLYMIEARSHLRQVMYIVIKPDVYLTC
jgi:hypothetical protein